MEELSTDQSELQKLAVPEVFFDFHRPASNVSIPHRFVEKLPGSLLVHLALVTMNWVCGEHPDSAVICAIRERGIWSSSECPTLYRYWRLGNGLEPEHSEKVYFRDIHDGTVYRADQHERKSIEALLVIALFSGWGWSLGREGTQNVVHCDHDGMLWIVSPDEHALKIGAKYINS